MSAVVIAVAGERCTDRVVVSLLLITSSNFVSVPSSRTPFPRHQPYVLPHGPPSAATVPVTATAIQIVGRRRGGADAGIPVDLPDCAPTVEHVICVHKESELVTKLVDHSPLFAETSSDCLYLPDI